MTEHLSKANKQGAHNQEQDDVFGAVDSVSAKLDAIEKFVARRFDEISAEIDATSQQVDMAEDGIIKRFSEILEVIAAISHKGDGTTPANAGVELDAVVDMTEEAANKILDAAGRINTVIHTKDVWENPETRGNAIGAINADVEEIFMACSFQDITGQRIRKTLENLQIIEDRLGTALDKLGIKVKASADGDIMPKEYATSQSEIDDIFAESREKQK